MHSRCSINVLNVRNLVLLNNQWDNEIMDFGQDWPAGYVLLIIDVGICALDACRFFKAQRNQEPQTGLLLKGVPGSLPGSAYPAEQRQSPESCGFRLCPRRGCSETTLGERGTRLC